MVQVGGHAATVLDFEIPLRHGLRQTIGDTLGIGGIFRALRTIPVVLGIAEDMDRGVSGGVAPELHEPDGDALLGRATRALRISASSASATRSSTRPAGWPNSSDVPFDEVTFLGAGINHQSFILRFERAGEDLYPLLDEAIARDPELRRHVRVEMYRRLGYFPTESSEHGAEYVPTGSSRLRF